MIDNEFRREKVWLESHLITQSSGLNKRNLLGVSRLENGLSSANGVVNDITADLDYTVVASMFYRILKYAGVTYK